MDPLLKDVRVFSIEFIKLLAYNKSFSWKLTAIGPRFWEHWGDCSMKLGRSRKILAARSLFSFSFFYSFYIVLKYNKLWYNVVWRVRMISNKYKHHCDSGSLDLTLLTGAAMFKDTKSISLASVYLSPACKRCRLPRASKASFLPISAG